MKKITESFLQKHDQKTAGVSSLNIIYEGMKARVTEHLAKNQDLTILKTIPCTVVGWELHPADRVRVDPTSPAAST